MLSRADADLVRRDPAVPGLALALDPEAFASALAEQIGDPIESVEVSYVRYKPRQSCLVGYLATIDGKADHICATAYRADVSSKVAKAMCRPGRIALNDQCIVVNRFPDDDKLRALPWLASPEPRRRLLEKVLPNRPDLWAATLEPIRYKPERRFVARLLVDGAPKAAIKAYSPSGYDAASIHAKSFRPDSRFRMPDRLGRSNRHCLLTLEWLPGRLLTHLLNDVDLDADMIQRVGASLAALHEQRSKKLRCRTRGEEADGFQPLARWLAAVCPSQGQRAHALAEGLANQILRLPVEDCAVHGDFYAKQVVVEGDSIGIIDFDEAFRGDPAHDVGLFLAHLERDALRNLMPASRVDPVRRAFLDGYMESSPNRIEDERVALYAAAGLLRIAAHPFRHREPEWPERTAALLDGAERELRRAGTAPLISVSPMATATAPDVQMPFLVDALDVRRADAALHRHGILNKNQSVSDARMIRHKPARRCMIEYHIANQGLKSAALIGKARAKGLDRSTFDLVNELRRRGFDEASFVAVPEPVGVVPEFHMWLQRKIAGMSAFEALATTDGAALAARLADAIHKLHRADVPTDRLHTAGAELAALESLFDELAAAQPQWSRRLTRLIDACRQLLGELPDAPLVGIHRDFYPDQVLVTGDALYLLDLDLYSAGDPALDAGNLLGHLTEFCLRSFGDERAWADRERAFEDRFVELTGAHCRRAVQAYHTVTLARHIALSQRFLDRRHCTERLLDLCERRLGLGTSGRSAATVSSIHRLSIGG